MQYLLFVIILISLYICQGLPAPGETACQGDLVVDADGNNCACPGNTIDDGNNTNNCICPGNTVDDGNGESNCACPGNLEDDGTGNNICQCQAGFIGDGTGTNCIACQGDLVVDADGNNCACPGNLEDDGTGNNICQCQAGFIGDGTGTNCIVPILTILTNTTGEIISPGYPDEYPRNVETSWLVQLPPGKFIELSFTSFDTEVHYDCSFDSLTIYDGASDAFSVLGKYCGRSLPLNLISSSNQLFLRFKSDYHNSRDKGFKLEYESRECPYIKENSICGEEDCSCTCKSKWKGDKCQVPGGTLTDPNGVITSPRHPKKYPNNIEPEWLIQLPPGQIIKLNFTSFELERSFDCRYDSLAIFNGPSDSSPVLGKFCGYKQPPNNLTSSSNQLFIRFKSDQDFQYKGFKLQYNSTSEDELKKLIPRNKDKK